MQILLSIGCKPYHYQVAKSSILNVAEFLDLSLKTLPCTKASQVSYENQSFFSSFPNVAIFIKFGSADEIMNCFAKCVLLSKQANMKMT